MQTGLILIGLSLFPLFLIAGNPSYKYEFTVTRIALDMQHEKEKYEEEQMQYDKNCTQPSQREKPQ